MGNLEDRILSTLTELHGEWCDIVPIHMTGAMRKNPCLVSPHRTWTDPVRRDDKFVAYIDVGTMARDLTGLEEDYIAEFINLLSCHLALHGICYDLDPIIREDVILEMQWLAAVKGAQNIDIINDRGEYVLL